jgi:hypothetical protein
MHALGWKNTTLEILREGDAVCIGGIASGLVGLKCRIQGKRSWWVEERKERQNCAGLVTVCGGGG